MSGKEDIFEVVKPMIWDNYSIVFRKYTFSGTAFNKFKCQECKKIFKEDDGILVDCTIYALPQFDTHMKILYVLYFHVDCYEKTENKETLIKQYIIDRHLTKKESRYIEPL